MTYQKNKKRNLRAQKKTPRLGQHFLRDHHVLLKAMEAAQLTMEDTVLEIGPGEGVLTKALLARAGRVIAIEKDPRLFERLAQTFGYEIETKKLLLLNQDIRAFIPSQHSLHAPRYKLIANIPYYITGEILRQFLSARMQPSLMVLLIQKEVAERIVARDEKESLLSLSVKAYGEPHIVRIVKAGAFSPPPKVDSALLLIDNISRTRFKTRADEDRFFTLIHAGFAQKRKTLAGNLKRAGFEREAAQIEQNRRAEELTQEEWSAL